MYKDIVMLPIDTKIDEWITNLFNRFVALKEYKYVELN